MTMKKALLSGAAALAMVTAAHTAQAADAVGNASATIVAPIAVTQATALSFGNMSPTTAAGSVVISTAGARTATNVDLLTGGTTTAAAFNVTGDNSATFAITLPTSTTLTGPGPAMAVSSFNHDEGGTPALDGSGSAAFNIGATLAVDTSANQTAGAYSGTYNVTVNYN